MYRLAKEFQKKSKLSPEDAIHLACACYTESDFFITCDDELIKRTARLNPGVKIMNPVEYIREVDKI